MQNRTPEEAIQTIRKNWPDERYTMLREALEYAITAIEEDAALKQEIEQLNADKAALLECVKWYADRKNYVMDPETKFRPAAWDSGDLARECLAQIGGTQ